MASDTDAYREALYIARESLQQESFGKIARRCGGQGTKSSLLLPYLIHTLEIDTETLKVSFLDPSLKVKPQLEILTLHYLKNAQNIPARDKLISFKQLPEGITYYPSFHNRVEKPLVEEFKNSLGLFKKCCERLGGKSFEQGDVAYRISTFPRLPLSYVIWKGDQEFPLSLSLLFDETASEHLPVEDLAVLGELVSTEIISKKEDVNHG